MRGFSYIRNKGKEKKKKKKNKKGKVKKMLPPEYPWSTYWTGISVLIVAIVWILVTHFRKDNKNKEDEKDE